MRPLEPILMAVSTGAAARTPDRVSVQRALAREALRECAQRCGAPADGWEKDENDVPQPRAGYHWSISHKRRWVAAVVAERPVGIDIEQIVPRNEAMFEALAGEDEWTTLGERSWHAFFRLWTAKEATLKANGKGIEDFSKCRLVEVPDQETVRLIHNHREWMVQHFFHDEHVAAVTCVSSDVRWRVLDGRATLRARRLALRGSGSLIGRLHGHVADVRSEGRSRT